MKTVYINESMAKLLKESVLVDALPAAIRTSASQTPYGNAPMFMGHNGMGNQFIQKALVSQFESAKNTLKNFGQIDSVNANTVEDAFQKIVLKCQKIEEKNRDALEKLAANYVINLFSIPDDTVTIETKLTNEIENADDISPVEPFDGDVEFETADLDDLSGIDLDVAKRHFLNALNMGAGMSISENIRGYIEDLYDIDSRLPQLYKEALALNNYMIFKSPDLGISDNERNQIGVVNVKLGSNDELVVVSAEGVIFPILLCELIRGMMELFSSHGLPKDRARREYIIKKADYLKAEPWQMRIGPYMWKIFTDYFEGTDTSEMPYIYQTLAKLKGGMFFKVISEMMARTKRGKMYAEKIMNKALHKKEEASFNDKMSTYSKNKSIITDGYMSPEEF